MYKKILVICPANMVTGGPEALHQLVNKMRKYNLPAYIVYLPFHKASDTPAQYKKYNAPIATYVDEKETLIIFPEIYPHLAKQVKNAKAAIWWLSLENFLERRHVSWVKDKVRYFKQVLKGKRPLFGAASLKDLIHLSQTEHSTQYLKSCGIEPIPLIDCINEDFLTDRFLDQTSHKKDVILYNPTKGKEVVTKLILENPLWEFVPLKGLNPCQLSEKFYSAKIYIDFGHHPGRDRMPREAAMHGCCLLTGLLGSAGNLIDLPIPRNYKLNHSSPTFVQDFREIADDIMNNFDHHYNQFATYRTWLKNEPHIFETQIINYFIKA